jgi:hypothetical protein
MSPWRILRFGGVVATRNLIVVLYFVGYSPDSAKLIWVIATPNTHVQKFPQETNRIMYKLK